jgi:hypothetical protein
MGFFFTILLQLMSTPVIGRDKTDVIIKNQDSFRIQSKYPLLRSVFVCIDLPPFLLSELTVGVRKTPAQLDHFGWGAISDR